MRLRNATTGPEFKGNAVGDVAVWNGTQWLPEYPGNLSSTRYVRTIADLPSASGGVITLEPGLIWNFVANVTAPSDVQLVQPFNAFVQSVVGHGGWVSDCDGVPGMVCQNYYNFEPFYTQSVGTGDSLLVQTGTSVAANFVNWYVPAKTTVQSLYLEWALGRMDAVEVLCNGGDFRFSNIRWMGSILFTGGTGRVDLLSVLDCGKIGGSGERPLVDFDDGTFALSTTIISRCRSQQGGLLRLPASFNNGVGWNTVIVSDCEVQDLAVGPEDCIVLDGGPPLGGISVSNCKLHGTPLTGFNSASARTFVRGSFTETGFAAATKMTETVITP